MDKTINELFVNKTNEYNNYKWDNIKNYFIDICNNIIKTIQNNNVNDFIFYYYKFFISYNLYINHLFYLDKDIHNEILLINKQLRIDSNITKFLFDNKNNNNIKEIIKYIYPFYSSKSNNNSQQINTYIKNYEYLRNNEYSKLIDKILELICFRYKICNINGYNNYHSFFIKKILNKKTSPNFKKFIKILPKKHNLFNFNIETNNQTINIDIDKVIIHCIKKLKPEIHKNKQFKKKKNNTYIIKSNNDIIEIIIDKNRQQGITNHKNNLTNLYSNIDKLNNIQVLKDTNNHIIIYFNTKNINNLGLLLNIIHFITIAFKTIDNNPSNINEINNRVPFTNYYYLSFCIFINFVKNEFDNKDTYQLYLLELIKYFYIYSIYDYYFYYDNNTLQKLEENNNNFINICDAIKNDFNIPKNISNYPPFNVVDIEDINQPIYYSYEIPNYFKLFDLINSLIDIYNITNYNNFDDIIKQIFNITKNNNPNIKSYNKKIISKAQVNKNIDINYTELDEDNQYQLKI